MDFSFTKDQDLIRKSVREFLGKECPKEKVRELKTAPKGYDPKAWKKMVKLGFMGLVVPEEYGGTEGEFIDLMIFMEEMGRNIFPSSYFTTVVGCSLPVLQFGTKAQKEAILPKIVEKGEIWSYAQDEERADGTATDIKLTASREGDHYILNGTKLFVPYANVAKKILVTARTDRSGTDEEGITLFYLDTKSNGIEIEVMPTTARDMRCQVKFNQVKVPAENILGECHKGWDIVYYISQNAAVLKAAEMSGGARAGLDLTVNYVKDRKQFNKPIGSLQAIQHKLVEMFTDVEGLKFLVYQAAWRINSHNPSSRLNSMVKIKANTVYHNIGYFGIFLHGAIGWTEEMDIGLYHIRSRANISDAGGTDFHYDLLANGLADHKPAFLEIYPQS
jgi:alkylation response protein AidB-like acyl-CoA dehydrogenase